jgi:hypothetical protein
MRRTLVAPAVVALMAVVGGTGMSAASSEGHTGSKAPVVAGLTVRPGVLADAGGAVALTARVTRATECKVTVSPEISGLPATFRCHTGAIARTVTFPRDASHAAHRFTVALVAAGTHGRSSERVYVTVRGAPTPRPPSTPTTTSRPAPTTTTTSRAAPTTTTTVGPVPTTTTTTLPPATTTTTAPVDPVATLLYLSQGLISHGGADVTFTYSTSNPVGDQAGCGFYQVAYLPGGPVEGSTVTPVSGPYGPDIPCNQTDTTVVHIPAEYDADVEWRFGIFPGVDSQGVAGTPLIVSVTQAAP